MKQNLLAFGAAIGLMAMGMSSCNLEPDKNDSKLAVTFNVYNHISRTDGTGTPVVSRGEYRWDMNMTTDKATCMSPNLTYDNAAHTMTVDTIPFTATTYTNPTLGYGDIFQMYPPAGNVNIHGGTKVSDLRATMSPFCNAISSIMVPGYATETQVSTRLVMDYVYDEQYRIRTFYDDVTYGGETLTTYPGAEGTMASFSTQETFYRLVMDVKTSTADLIVYRARFAAQMPSLQALVVKGLELRFTKDGFVAEGDNIIPDMIENNEATPAPRYPFNSVRVTSDNDRLTGAQIDFQVAGAFTGKFTGEWIWLPNQAN